MCTCGRSRRQRAELPIETLAAGVVLAGLAPAVASPVAEGLDDGLKGGLIGEDGSAFARGDVVGGIEAESGEIAEGPDLLVVVGGSEGVAAVFDEPEVVLLCEGYDGSEIEGLPRCARS